jgi:VirE N-terminal domain./Primase C terminal 2 (PriCT-2).
MNKLLDTYVSYYNNFRNKRPIDMNLLDLLITNRFKDSVFSIRNAQTKDERTRLKQRLPFFTPSGRFRTLSASGLIQHTGLICIDIDEDDNLDVSDFDNLKNRISKLPYIAYCGKSVSGNGYFCIIPIAYPDKHIQHFHSFKQTFTTMGITIDDSCSDICRKRFVSYDSAPYINQEAKPYFGLIEFSQLKQDTKHNGMIAARTNQIDMIQIQRYMDIIEQQKIDITRKYNDWFSIGCVFANSFGEDGRRLFHAVSRFYERYDYTETDNLFNIIQKGKSNNPPTIRTFLWLCREAGLDKFINYWSGE